MNEEQIEKRLEELQEVHTLHKVTRSCSCGWVSKFQITIVVGFTRNLTEDYHMIRMDWGLHRRTAAILDLLREERDRCVREVHSLIVRCVGPNIKTKDDFISALSMVKHNIRTCALQPKEEKGAKNKSQTPKETNPKKD